MFGLDRFTSIFRDTAWRGTTAESGQLPPEAAAPDTALAISPRWIKVVVILLFGLCLSGFLTDIFLLNRYLPSHAWLRASEPYVTIFGVATALMLAALGVLGLKRQALATGRHRKGFELTFILAFGLFLFYIPTVDLLRRGIPGMFALALGERVQHTYFIEDTDQRGDKRCRRPIKIRDMPFMTSLCEMPQEFRAQLHPGMSVVFVGKGTWMGLFVEDFRKP